LKIQSVYRAVSKSPVRGSKYLMIDRDKYPHVHPHFPVRAHWCALWWWDRYVHNATEYPQMGNTRRITTNQLQRGSCMVCSWAQLY
jgi:hypothetical protein